MKHLSQRAWGLSDPRPPWVSQELEKEDDADFREAIEEQWFRVERFAERLLEARPCVTQ